MKAMLSILELAAVVLAVVIVLGLVALVAWKIALGWFRSSMRAGAVKLINVLSRFVATNTPPRPDPRPVPPPRATPGPPPARPNPTNIRMPDEPTRVLPAAPAPTPVGKPADDVPAESGPPPTASLRAIRGSTLDVLLTKSTITIGRGPDRDIMLDAKTVSRRHCTLRFRTDRWYLQDDSSPNGTLVNGTRLLVGAQVPLDSGDRIGVGDDVLLTLTTPRIDNQDLVLTVGAATDKGGRARNEDALCATATVIAVADGVGGRPGGDIASGIAVSLAGNASAGLPLAHLVPAMNAAIMSRGRSDSSLQDMATTFDGAQLITDTGGGIVRGIHIGDGCALRDDGSHIKTLTVPHTLGSRLARDGNPLADRHPDRARLLRVLGMPSVPEFDQWEERAVAGHRYVLSTDGLLNAMNTDELNAALVKLRGVRPEQAARILIDAVLHGSAAARKALDNLTVVIADVSQRVDSSRSLPAAAADSTQHQVAIRR
jgi:pSer/pThr/pTyr-binding forkhead associated (FHA) protein